MIDLGTAFVAFNSEKAPEKETAQKKFREHVAELVEAGEVTSEVITPKTLLAASGLEAALIEVGEIEPTEDVAADEIDGVEVTRSGSEIYWPSLYRKTKGGKIAWYRICVKHGKQSSQIVREKASGLDDKSQTDIEVITEGVNIGKANETTRQRQAEFEAGSRYRKLLDQGYKTEMPDKDATYNTDASGETKPMLAQSLNPDKVEFPMLLQPKYNGLRCKADGLKLISRAGKPYVVEHIIKALEELKSPYVLDGEIYIHGKYLQEINAATKKPNELTPELTFVVYDIVIAGVPFKERLEMLKKLLPDYKFGPIILSPTVNASNMGTIEAYHGTCTSQGYEGVMARNPEGMYEFGFRSKALLKYKKMITEEFTILWVYEATGRDKGTAIFRCARDKEAAAEYFKNPELGEDKKWIEQNTFGCRPEGSREVRAAYFENADEYTGKPLTVQFQEYSKDKMPIFPVGIVVREDLPEEE